MSLNQESCHVILYILPGAPVSEERSGFIPRCTAFKKRLWSNSESRYRTHALSLNRSSPFTPAMYAWKCSRVHPAGLPHRAECPPVLLNGVPLGAAYFALLLHLDRQVSCGSRSAKVSIQPPNGHQRRLNLRSTSLKAGLFHRLALHAMLNNGGRTSQSTAQIFSLMLPAVATEHLHRSLLVLNLSASFEASVSLFPDDS